MKWYDEEVARNLLWMKPGVKFWWRQTAIGPIAVGRIIEVNTKRQYVLCDPCEEDNKFSQTFRLGLDEPQHMSTYPGDNEKHFTWYIELDNILKAVEYT